MSDVDPREQLSAYLDGVLAAADRVRLDEALLADSDLRTELEELRALVEDVHALSSEQAPEGLADAVMAEVKVYPIPGGEGLDREGEETPRDRLIVLSWWVKGPVVSLLAASLVMGIIVYKRGGEVPVPSSLRPAASLFETADSELAPVDHLRAPRPTGADGFESDGVVDASTDGAEPGLEAEVPSVPSSRRSPEASGRTSDLLALDSSSEPGLSGPAASKPINKRGDPRGVVAEAPVRGGGDRRARKRSSGLRELRGKDGAAEQIYEADHEGSGRDEGALVADWNGGSPDPVEAADGSPETDGQDQVSGESSVPLGVVGDDGVVEVEAEPDARETALDPLRSGSRGAKRSLGVMPVDEQAIVAGAVRRGGDDSMPDSGSTVASGAPGAGGGGSMLRAQATAGGGVVATAVREAESDGQQSIAVGVVIGSLRVREGLGLSLLRTEIRKRGWSMQDLTPVDLEEQASAVENHIIQLMVPKGDEEQLVELLRRYGVLTTDGALRAGRDGMARLRVTVKDWFLSEPELPVRGGAAKQGP